MRIKLSCILLALLTAPAAYSQAPDDIDAPEAQQDSNPYEEMSSVIKKSPTVTVIENNVYDTPECSEEDDSGCAPEVPEKDLFHIRTGTEVACASAGTASFLRNNNLDYAEITHETVNIVRRGTVGPSIETEQRETTTSLDGLDEGRIRRDNLKFSLVAWTKVGRATVMSRVDEERVDQIEPIRFHVFPKNVATAMQGLFISYFKTEKKAYGEVENPPTDLPVLRSKITVEPPLSGYVHAIAYDDDVPSNAGEAFLKPADLLDGYQASSLIEWQRDCASRRQELKENVNPDKIAECNKILLNDYFKQVYKEHQAWSSGGGADQKPKLVYSTHFAVQSCKEYSRENDKEEIKTAREVIEYLKHYSDIDVEKKGDKEAEQGVFHELKEKFDKLLKEYKKLIEQIVELGKKDCLPPADDTDDCLTRAERRNAERKKDLAIGYINEELKKEPLKDLKTYIEQQSSCYHLRSEIHKELGLTEKTVAYSPKWWEHTDLGFACKLLHEQIKEKTKVDPSFTTEFNKLDKSSTDTTLKTTAESELIKSENISAFLSNVLKLEQKELDYQDQPTKKNFVCSPDTKDVYVSAPTATNGPTPDWHRLLSSAVLDMRQDLGVLKKKPHRIFSSTHPSGDFGFNKTEQYLVTRDPQFMTFYTSLEGQERGEKRFPTGLGLPMVIVPGEEYKLPSVIKDLPNNNGFGISVYAYPISICEIVTITRFPARHR